MSRLRRICSVLGILLCGVAWTQEPPSADVQLDTVTVTGRKREKIFQDRINTFVSSVTLRSRTESLARWQVPVCPYVTGAAPDQNAYIRQHLAQVAKDAGARLAQPDCAANLVVVLTEDPDRLLHDWWALDHGMFNTDRGVRGVERFIRAEEAIRAWYNACNVAPGWAKSNANQRIPPCNTGELGSRLSWDSVRAIYSVIVVVDLARIERLNVGQVADYVAMIGLAQIRRDADLGKLPTILRLFTEAGSARPRGLSSWDKSFLRSLYGTESANFMQFSQIKSGMGLDLGGSGPDPIAAHRRILAQVNRITPQAGRLVSYTETGAYYEGPPDLQTALVNFEAELEFVANTYFHGDRQAGERVSLYGEVEYANEGDGWRLLRLAVHPR